MSIEDDRTIRRALQDLIHKVAKTVDPYDVEPFAAKYHAAIDALNRLAASASSERRSVLTFLHNLQQGDLLTLEEKRALFAAEVAIRNGEHISGGGK